MVRTTHYVDKKRADGFIVCACSFAGPEGAFLYHIERVRREIAKAKEKTGA